MSQRRLLPPSQLPPSPPKPRGGGRPYRRGSRAERELQRDLAADGALVIRSAGSAGPYDLVVLAVGGGRALQVKLVSAPPTAGRIRRWLAALPDLPPGWQSELWVKTAGHGWECYRK